MWKAINSIIYGEKQKIETGLICPLYLNKDKSKSINIQVYEKTTCKQLYDNFKEIIEGNITLIDKETQEYKFVLKDISNNYNEFILKDNFIVFNYLMNDKYELFYLAFYKKKSYTISMALKEKNSFQHENVEENIQFKPLKEQLVKQDTAYKYSKKQNQFVKINIYLHRDILEIEKLKSKKGSVMIPLSSISDIKEIYDRNYKQGYSTMMISSVYSSKTKKYYLSLSNDSFDSWFSVLNNHLHQFLDTYSFMKICKDSNDLNRKKTSFIIQLINKFTNIKGVLSLNFSKKIFYDFYKNQNIKDIYDLNQRLQENMRGGKSDAAQENLEKIVNILENEKDLKIEFQENKNVLEILKEYVEKMKKKEVKKNDVFFYKFNDSLIMKYFEPRFSEIISDQKMKMDFLNKIMDFILKKINKEDNQFCDLNSCIDELIIVND